MTLEHGGAAAPDRETAANYPDAEHPERNTGVDTVDSTLGKHYAVSTAPRKDSKNWASGSILFSEIVEWAKSPADHKECGNYLMGTIRGERRTKSAIVSRSAVQLDADSATEETWDAIRSLGALGLVHTTYSSAPDELRLRAILPLDRGVTPDEYVHIVAVLIDRLGKDAFDPGSLQAERYMFRPSANDEHPGHYRFEVLDGPELIADELLAEVPEVPEAARESHDGPKRDPRTLDGVPGAFNRAYSIAEAIQQFGVPYEPAGDGRYHLIGAKTGAGISEVTPDLVHSHHARDPAYGMTLSAFDLVRVHLYGLLDEEDETVGPETAINKLPSTLSAIEKLGMDPRVVEELAAAETAEIEVFEELPEELGPYGAVFEASDRLAQIRSAAHARMVSAAGLLAYILGRVLAEVPPSVKLPPVIGSAASLNLGVAVVAESGGGKSALMEVSRELLGFVGTDQEHIERSPGSGEGMVETYLQTVGRGKAAVKELIDDPRRVMVVDEIGQLGAVQGRNGATIAPTLRSALTGSMLGQENASAETRRHVPSGTYRLVLFAGVQPTRSDVLLDDADAGTPQRFVWVPADDETIPPPEQMPEWPGDLGWRLPELDEVVDYPDDVKDQVRRDRWEQMRGKDSTGLRGHLNLTRLKVAAALAILHEQTSIDGHWWELAGVIVDASMQLQDECRARLTHEVERARYNLGRLDQARADGAAEVRDIRAVQAAQAIFREVLRHTQDVPRVDKRKHAFDAGCTDSCLRHGARNYRKHGPELIDAARAVVEAESWIEERNGRWFLGPSRPAERAAGG